MQALPMNPTEEMKKMRVRCYEWALKVMSAEHTRGPFIPVGKSI